MAPNCTHIRTLYNEGNQDGVDFVMERFEGETLTQRSITGALVLPAERGAWTHRDVPTGYR